ncbi:hypothetical protein AAG906_005524 [Vitis piasezkii]
MASSSSPLVFSVNRCDPQIVRPANPTPGEVKQLSDIDDQEGLRIQIPGILPSFNGRKRPCKGRLIEGDNRKLMVDCTGEGVLFIEADADTTPENLGEAIQPMCPYFEELLYDVTRLRCGGFIFALRLNHTMSDPPSLIQFLNTIGEMAQGLYVPSLPIWQRELLKA